MGYKMIMQKNSCTKQGKYQISQVTNIANCTMNKPHEANAFYL